MPPQPPPPRIPLGRLALSGFLVASGLTLIMVVVGLIYWPADLIILGVILVAVGAFFVQIGPPTPPEVK